MFYNICPSCNALSVTSVAEPKSWFEVDTPAGHSLDCDVELHQLSFVQDDSLVPFITRLSSASSEREVLAIENEINER